MHETLGTLLSRKNQRFICVNTTWPELGTERHIAKIRHDVAPPLAPDELDELRHQLGEMSEVLEFYRQWGSARLYCDTVYNKPIGYAAAFFIAPPANWPLLREGFEDWLNDLDEDERAELLPEWCDCCVAIGEIPNSGNYFLLPIGGSDRGKVFMFDHDGFEFTEQGQNFEEFVKTLCTVNAALLQEIRGHTRYSDGKTAVQWLCHQYLYDAGNT